MASKSDKKILKEKEPTLAKVEYPDYQEMSNKRDDLTNDLRRLAACNEGLAALAKEWRGRRGVRKLENVVAAIFSLPEAEAMVHIDGLGTYRAVVSDVRVAMDKDKEPVPMYEILVYRGDGVEFVDDDPDIYYDNSWGWNLMECIHDGVNKLFDALEHEYRKDYYALPEEMRG